MSDIFTPEAEKTREEKIKDLVSDIYKNNMIARDALIYAINFAISNIWQNPEYAPQEILNVVGTNGKRLFMVSGIIQDTLEQIIPGYQRIVVPEDLYTINEDGTVTHNV